MKYIKRLSNYGASIGLGAILAVGLSGCGGGEATNQTQASAPQPEQKNAFVVIEETAPGKYKIAEEFPAKETRIILKKLDGTEKVLTKEEMDELVKKEEAKIENGTSPLTSPQGAQMAQQGGLSLGEALLASAAGAVVGSWIGNKLFNNPNYQQTRRATYKSPSAYSRSVNSFKRGSSSFGSSASRSSSYSSRTSSYSSSRRSGFFGRSSTSSSRRSSGFFGG